MIWVPTTWTSTRPTRRRCCVVRITVWVRPGSLRPGVGGELDGALVVRVSARAVDGQATAAALAAVAAALGVRRRRGDQPTWTCRSGVMVWASRRVSSALVLMPPGFIQIEYLQACAGLVPKPADAQILHPWGPLLSTERAVLTR